MQKFLLIAHRGASAVAPENSKAALEEALRLGANAIEIDLRLTKDREWVVIHDPDLSRTFQAKGGVAGYTLSELKKMRRLPRERTFAGWKSSADRTDLFAETEDESILALDEVYRLIPEEKTLFLDIKEKSASLWVKKMRERPRPNIVVCSVFPRFLRTVKRRFSDQPCGLTVARLASWMLSCAHRLRIFSIHPHLSLCSPSFIEEAHRSGLRVYPWTVNLTEEIRRLKEWGVDGVFTDFPGRALRACQDARNPSPGELIGSVSSGR